MRNRVGLNTGSLKHAPALPQAWNKGWQEEVAYDIQTALVAVSNTS